MITSLTLDTPKEQLGLLLGSLRRILQLSADATIDDINQALLAIESGDEVAVKALSAECRWQREPTAAEKINRLLGVTPKLLRKWD